MSGLAAATVGAAVAVGSVLFVPWQNGTSASGPLPGDADHTYAYNSDEGLLQVRPENPVHLAGATVISQALQPLNAYFPRA